MVLKAMKNSLKNILSGKAFLSKKIFENFFPKFGNFMDFGNLSEVQKCSEVHVKNNFAF